MAERSYPSSKVGVAAGRSYPTSEVRGGGQECQAVTVQELPREATPCPRSGAAAKRSSPMSKERWLRGRRRAERSYSTFEVRRGGQRGDTPSSKVRSSGCALLEQP